MEPSSKTPSLPTTTTAAAAVAAAALWASPAAAVFRPHTAAFRLNLNNEDDGELLVEDEPPPPPPPAADGGGARHHLQKEPLFEKPLTPSDVGKLNRLVIPKQHAEKYFPLNAAGGGGGGGEKGLLLGFEDEAGKAWRFRYSYWNSSQSYVLTKGWSRFVKEKRLDAGDIVLFSRHPDDLGRLFIGWRRRNGGGGENGGVAPPPGGGWSGLVYTAHPYPTNQSSNSSVLYQTECPHAGNYKIKPYFYYFYNGKNSCAHLSQLGFCQSLTKILYFLYFFENIYFNLFDSLIRDFARLFG